MTTLILYLASCFKYLIKVSTVEEMGVLFVSAQMAIPVASNPPWSSAIAFVHPSGPEGLFIWSRQ